MEAAVTEAVHQVVNPHWRSERNARWIESNLRIPEGKLVGRPVQLTPEQRSWLVDIYDSPTRTFILSMGRKNAKTSFSAMLLLLHLCGPEATRNSQLNSAAQSRDQAAILFSLGAKMVRMSTSLKQRVVIRDSSKQLAYPELGTLYRALSADAQTAFGLSPAFTVHDELGQVRGPRSDLYEALETASAAHENPLSIIISTQAPTDADLLSKLIDDALTNADPRVKVRLYTADMTCDPFSVEAIRQANPHFDVFMNQEEVLRQAAEAERIPSREASYRNLILNQRVEAKQPFVVRSVWEENGAEPKSLKGRTVYGGLDLSSVHDLTALVLLAEDGDVVPTFWLPDEGLKEKARADRVPYDIWRDNGFLQTTPGRAISYKFVAEYLYNVVFKECTVMGIGFDRYNMVHLKPWLTAAGFTDDQLAKFIEFGQGFASMSPAIRALEEDLLGAKLRHGNHPVLAMCASNAVVATDPAENRKFVKGAKYGRIDGMVALAMAEGVRPRSIPEPEKKYQMFFA